jgi:glutamate-1-semialdehyde 2,1-aminomutase
MYQAGTLSGNPLAMTAGIKTLELLRQPGTYEKLAATTETLINGIKTAASEAGLPITGGSVSAMFGFFLCDGPVRNFEEAKATDSERFGKLHRAMLERGVYLAPSAFEAGFTSMAHSDADIDATLNAFRESFAAVA